MNYFRGVNFANSNERMNDQRIVMLQEWEVLVDESLFNGR